MSLSYAETLSIAEGTCRLIAPYCKATQIVGSLARELDFSDPRTSENIDILVVPNPELFPFISFQHYKKEVLNLT